MLYYDRIDVSQGIDANKTSVSKECIICHYWYLLDEEFKFQTSVFKGCQYILMMSMNLQEIGVLNIFSVDYLCIINEISKSEAIYLFKKMLI